MTNDLDDDYGGHDEVNVHDGRAHGARKTMLSLLTLSQVIS